MSRNTRSSSMEPKMTPDGKFLCEADNKTFNTKEDYNRHISEVHMRSSGSKGW